MLSSFWTYAQSPREGERTWGVNPSPTGRVTNATRKHARSLNWDCHFRNINRNYAIRFIWQYRLVQPVMGGVNVITMYKISSHSNIAYKSSTVEVRSAQCSLTEISKYHFNFCRQHQITYFISCPVKHNNATWRISFASVVQPCLPPRLAFLPTDSFNYSSGSDHITVNSPRESNGRASCLAARCVHFMAQSVSRGTWKLLLFFFVSFLPPCQPQTTPPQVFMYLHLPVCLWSCSWWKAWTLRMDCHCPCSCSGPVSAAKTWENHGLTPRSKF